MNNEDKLHCIICNKDFNRAQGINENINSLPRIISNKAICGYCYSEGWRICKLCEKPFNIYEVDYNKFYIYNDISDIPSPFYNYLNSYLIYYYKNFLCHKQDFCSNKDYNITIWAKEIKSSINILHEDKSFSKDNIDELEKYVDDKIDYIKNNL
ncbi:MAG: hypothetical protein LIR50_00115 [Bacillota bacterium]|nr:hypothetical protein [Bacillota bacterium]